MNVQVKVFLVTNTSFMRGYMTQQHKHLIVRADISWCLQEKDLNKISD